MSRAARGPAGDGARARRSTGCAARGWRRSSTARAPSRVGEADLVIAGGVESMSRAPLVMAKAREAFPRGDVIVYDTTLGWRFVNPRMEALHGTHALGETAELVAEKYGVTREAQDAFALDSQQRWAAAHAAGRFADELAPVDRCRRRRARRASTPTSTRAPRRRRRAGRADARVPQAERRRSPPATRRASTTARRRCCSRRRRGSRVSELGAAPLARFVASAVAGVEPKLMGLGPIPATQKALARAGHRRRAIWICRAERGVRRAGDPLRRELGLDPDAGQRQRRRDRDRPSAGRVGRAPGDDAGARARPRGAPLRPRHDVHRRRPGDRRDLRARHDERRPSPADAADDAIRSLVLGAAAHEIKNALGPLAMTLQLAERQLLAGQPIAPADMAFARAQVRRLSRAGRGSDGSDARRSRASSPFARATSIWPRS